MRLAPAALCCIVMHAHHHNPDGEHSLLDALACRTSRMPRSAVQWTTAAPGRPQPASSSPAWATTARACRARCQVGRCIGSGRGVGGGDFGTGRALAPCWHPHLSSDVQLRWHALRGQPGAAAGYAPAFAQVCMCTRRVRTLLLQGPCTPQCVMARTPPAPLRRGAALAAGPVRAKQPLQRHAAILAGEQHAHGV